MGRRLMLTMKGGSGTFTITETDTFNGMDTDPCIPICQKEEIGPHS